MLLMIPEAVRKKNVKFISRKHILILSFSEECRRNGGIDPKQLATLILS